MTSGDNGQVGSLIAVGTGIRIVGQLTTEAIAWMRTADRLLYVVGDPVAETVLRRLNPEGAESLSPLYGEGAHRLETYEAMTERMLFWVRAGKTTCAAFYGHPGVFAYPVHEAVRRARAEGYSARILPAVSALDCLFADLGIDPAREGCQSYDATDFLLHQRSIDPTAGVVLWQIGLVGDPLYRKGGYDRSLLPLLVERLCHFYTREHVVQVYEAAVYPATPPSIQQTPLCRLEHASLSSASTLYIPPAIAPTVDLEVWERIEALRNAGPAQAFVGSIPTDEGCSLESSLTVDKNVPRTQ